MASISCSTARGLSIVGEGEWAAAKHGGRGRRGWRKIHLGVDRSGVIRVHTLTEATGDDATTALDLLTAVEGLSCASPLTPPMTRSPSMRRRCCMKTDSCNNALFLPGLWHLVGEIVGGILGHRAGQ